MMGLINRTVKFWESTRPEDNAARQERLARFAADSANPLGERVERLRFIEDQEFLRGQAAIGDHLDIRCAAINCLQNSPANYSFLVDLTWGHWDIPTRLFARDKIKRMDRALTGALNDQRRRGP